jgi:urea-proton symporter
MLAGNVAALLSPMVFIPILTLIFGQQNYDYESMRNIRRVDDSEVAAAAHVDLELIPGSAETAPVATAVPTPEEEEETRKLNQAAFWARTLTVAMTLCLLILWPMPMYGSGYVFSKDFFTGWVVVGILWLFFTAFGVIIFPVYEGRASIAHTVRAMFLDATGRKKPVTAGMVMAQAQEDTTPSSPDEKLSVKT